MSKTKSQLRAEAVERLRKIRDSRYPICNADIGAAIANGNIDNAIDLLTDDAHEARGSYEERLYDAPVSDCPYCGCERVIIHDFNDVYEKPHSYRVEHMDEKEAFNAGCFESYYAFDSAEKAVDHANMRDPLTDEEQETNVSESIQNGEKDKSDTREKLEAADRVLSLLTGKERVFADDESHDEERDTREKLEADSLQDSREGLEEDVRGYYDEHECDTLMRVDFLDAVYAWLDRQAAITEREYFDTKCYDCQDAHDRQTYKNIERYAELQAKVDGLDELRIEACLERDKLRMEVDALTAERDELKMQLDTMLDVAREFRDEWAALQEKVDALTAELRWLKAENEQLREKLSRAYDNAHDTLRMMD